MPRSKQGETQTMRHAYDLREIRVYREGVEEGMEKGLEKGFGMAIEKAAARSAPENVVAGDITAILKLDAASTQLAFQSVQPEAGNAGDLPEYDIRRTRFYQEAVEDGVKKGIETVERMGIDKKIANVIGNALEKGIKTGVAFAIVKLAARKMPTAKIAAILEVDVALVRQVIQKRRIRQIRMTLTSDTLKRLADAGLDPAKLPRHIAIIMDGNGRWAQERGKQRIEGHLEGVNSVRRTIEECCRLGIGQLTLYCFCTENWKRPGRGSSIS